MENAVKNFDNALKDAETKLETVSAQVDEALNVDNVGRKKSTIELLTLVDELKRDFSEVKKEVMIN